MGGDVVGGVPVLGVLQNDQGADAQAERDGAFDGAGGAVTGLSDAEELAHLGEHDFDGPAGGVGADDLFGGGVQVGGDLGEVVVLGGVPQQDQADREVFPGPVPLDDLLAEVDVGFLPVPVDGEGFPGGAGGDLG